MTDKDNGAQETTLADLVLIGTKKSQRQGIEVKLTEEIDILLRARLTTIGSLLQRLYRLVEAQAEGASNNDDIVCALLRRYATAIGALIAGNCDQKIDVEEVKKRLFERLMPLTEYDPDGGAPVLDTSLAVYVRDAAVDGLSNGLQSPWPYPALPAKIEPTLPPIYPQMSGIRPIKDSLVNVGTFAEYRKLKLTFDTFAQRVMIDTGNRVSAELSDAVLLRLQREAHETGFMVKADTLANGLSGIARDNPRHPVLDYWSTLNWDGTERISTWLIKYCGAEDTPLHRAYARKFLIGAVRRVKHPGYLVRHVLVLEGPQHVGKSQAFRALAMNNNWFTDSLEVGSDSKTTIEQASGKLIVEIPELSGMGRRDVERIKADISKQSDRARLAYGRVATEVPRQFVMGATTNNERYLKDLTGNTRFWGVRVCKTRADIDLVGLKEAIPQLWAEANVAADTDEEIYLNDAQLRRDQVAAAVEREEVDPIVETWQDEFLNTKPNTKVIFTEQLWEAGGLADASKRLSRHRQLMGIAAERAGWELKRRSKRPGERVWAYVRITRH